MAVFASLAVDVAAGGYDASTFDVSSVSVALATLLYCIVSRLHHRRSLEPSGLIASFLLALLALDLGPLMLFRMPSPCAHQHKPLIIMRVTLELLLLVIESHNKVAYIRPEYQNVSPEITAGAVGRASFWWVNPILAQGYRSSLLVAGLPPLDSELQSNGLRRKAALAWDRRGEPENQLTLARILLRCLCRPFLQAMSYRLLLIFFKYSQPILIQQAIRHANEAQPRKAGGGLLLAAPVVYIGLAFSSATYHHRLNRLKVMVRGALICLIHDKTMHSSEETANTGRVVTLMSNDAEALADTAELFHETWGQVLEVIIGVFLLSREVGWIWPLPLVSRYVANNIRSARGGWNDATQARLTMTGAIIAAIKNVKMMGIQGHMTSYIETLRTKELGKAGSVRWIMVLYNASANALGIFTPVATLLLFATIAALNGSKLDVETAFTTIAILGLVTHPANMVMTIVPGAVASLSSFERIQSFLTGPDLSDQRIETRSVVPTSSSDDQTPPLAFRIHHAYIGHHDPVLQNINIEAAKGSVTFCTGATASGKSTLVRAILGEVSLSGGVIMVQSKMIGYCAQSTWLQGTTIRDAIQFHSKSDHHDDAWYERVLAACCLNQDLHQLPGGDQTSIGYQGMNLSGGRDREALYAKCGCLVLDDTLSGLDQNTQGQIFENLMGPKGLLRELDTTVFLTSHALQHFHLADQVIILGNQGILEQGPWDKLRFKRQQTPLTHIAPYHDDDYEQGYEIPRPNETLKPALRANISSIELDHRTGDASLYTYYLRSVGWRNLTMVLASCTAYSFFITSPQYWLKMWTESGSVNQTGYILGFLLQGFLAWASTSVLMWSTLMLSAPHSGQVLHSKILKIVMCAPLSYFSVTGTGDILNRFSQDIQLIDTQLSQGLQNVAVQTTKLLFQAAFLFVSQKVLALTLPFTVAVVCVVQKLYLRTSRQLRFLELDSRSAVLESFLGNAEGVATIRAFHAQHAVTAAFLDRLDASQKPLYLLLCLQRWLNLVLNLMVAALAIGIISLAIWLQGTVSGGQIGMALNIVLVANTTLLRLVEYYTDLEISLGAVARLRTLERTVTPEDIENADDLKFDTGSHDSNPPRKWPNPGAVEFRKVTVSYKYVHSDIILRCPSPADSKSQSPGAVALRDFYLTIRPGQLVVIAGRTGRGKSSVLLTLLGLLDVIHGTLEAHGLDLQWLPIYVVREQLFVTIPQDAMLLDEATLRFNIDPSESLANDTIASVLEKTQLWKAFQPPSSDPSACLVIETDALSRILDQSLTALPALSAGQRQLLALARALLQAHAAEEAGRSKPIVLLDEALSAVDAETEGLMLDLIKEEFTDKGYTVIMVAHRLDAIKKRLREGVDEIIQL
ncbi:ABC transporter [Apiospora hydei]|uniref:ABC transporter n=1 Tax=Apiospora hydei TaxID=1337664 RepID=A0ABR1WA77_9PEZI